MMFSKLCFSDKISLWLFPNCINMIEAYIEDLLGGYRNQQNPNNQF